MLDRVGEAPGFRAPEVQGDVLDALVAAPAYNRWLFERALPHLGASVLDAGAGIGTFTELALDAGRRVTALEPDPAFAERLEARFGGREGFSLECAELQEGAIPTGFDSVLCFNVLEHLPDDHGALRALREALRPGGRLLLLVPAHPFLFGVADSALGHERRYRRGDLERLVRECGFRVVEARSANPVGGLGWLVSSRLLRRPTIARGPLRLYDRLVPAFKALDALRLPFGLSVWLVAERPSP